MNRPGKTTLGIGIGLAMTGALLALALKTVPTKTHWWTDGGAIRVPLPAAPVREILWRPAEPLKRSSGIAIPGDVPENTAGNTPAPSPASATGDSPLKQSPAANPAPHSADEYEPRYSADGTMLVFVRGQPGHNADLYMSRWSPTGWTTPTPIESVNTPADELGPELSRDGTSLYFYSDRPGGLGGYDLWVSHASASGWDTPTNLGPRINSRWNEYGPGLSPNSDRIYFSSNRPRDGEPVPSSEVWNATVREHRTRHDYDLYSAEIGEQASADAKPIAALNTLADEGAPAVSPAGDYLYFASDRVVPGALGGFDLYRARISGASEVGPAENLGSAVNSAANDLDPALSSDGFRLCFSSDRPVPGLSAATQPTNQPAPEVNAGPPAFDDSPAPGRYTLWSSVSREVYRQTQETASAWPLATLWPYLLLCLLALLPIILLYRLLRDGRWRQRFARLNLIAQCLLISLIIHVALASLLTIWKVGSGIIDIIQHGGGTRVILTSSSPGGSVVGQVRAVISSESSAMPEMSSIAASLPDEPIEAPHMQVALPDLVAPMIAMAAIDPQSRPERLTADTQVPVDAPASPIAAATVPTSAAPAPASSEAAIPPTTTAQFTQEAKPTIAAPSVAPVSIQLAKLSMPTPSVTPLDVPRPQERLSASQPVPVTPAPASTHSATVPLSPEPQAARAEPQATESLAQWWQEARPTVTPTNASRVAIDLPKLSASTGAPAIPVDVPSPSPRGEHTTPSTLPSTPAPSSTVSVQAIVPSVQSPAASQSEPAAPSAGGPLSPPTPYAAAQPAAATGANRVDVPLRPMSDSAISGHGSTAALALTSTTTARSEPIGASLPAALPIPQATGTSHAALPRVAAEQPAGPREPSLPSIKHADSPIAAAARPSTPSPSRTNLAIINPGTPSPTAKPDDLLFKAIVPGTVNPSRERTGPSLTAPILPVPGATFGGSARLPSEPIAPPTPVETFAQRAPEVRNELIEKMGGSAETERAVGLALDWFSRHQDRDGHWSAEHFDDNCGHCNAPAEFKADAAMTGMALLCYLGAGHTHQQEGPYRDAVGRGISWLVARQAADGDLRRGETMYGQTVATVALCEAFSMTRDPALADPARKAVAFVLARATGEQGRDERDTSVLGWLVFTVESARRAGVDVPRSTFDSAGKFLDYVTVPGSPGVYAYSKGKPASAAMTAEAMFVQQLLGHTRAEAAMDRSARFILRTLPKWGEGAPTYYWYYATLALFQHQGDAWKQWNESLVRELLAHQQREGASAGSWDPTDQWSRMGGRIYQTAACTLSLEVYYRYRAK